MKSVLTGMVIFTGAAILLITGCTAENPVSPAIDGTGGEYYSPGTDAILIQPEISGDILNGDLMTIESMEKSTPDVVVFPYDDPVHPDPGVHIEADIMDQEFTR